jgi:glucose dehydrogenase
VLCTVVFLALLAYQPPLVLFGGFVGYAISGYAVSGWRLVRRRRAGSAN